MRKISFFIVITLLFGQLTPFSTRQTYAHASAAPAANKYKSQVRTLEDFLKKRMAADQVPGVSIGFVEDDFVWANGYGFADLENKFPATVESSYRLASVTKLMTAAAVLLLAERGKINLDAEVQTLYLV